MVSAHQRYPPLPRAWALVAVLFLANIVNSIDRGILNLVVDPLRRDLMISDVQISLLQGVSFGLFYASIGLPLGLVADRVRRKWLLIFGVTVWSLATIMGGFAPNYGWMFVSRLLVGLGEATLGPCALSLISDSFPSARRGRPISVHLMGGAIGGSLGVMLVGWVTSQASRGVFAKLAGAGAQHVSPWRLAFIIAGALGVFIVALLLVQREPARRGLAIGHRDSLGTGLKRTGRYLAANWGVFLPFYIGFGMTGLAGFAAFAWTAALAMRQFAMTTGEVGKTLGLATLFAGPLATLLAGQLIDSQAGRWSKTAKMALMMILPLCALPAAFAVFAPNGVVAILLMVLMFALLPMVTTVALSAVSDLTPNNMRGFAVSLFGLTNTVIGQMVGPLLVATATEHVFHAPKLVGYSLLIVIGPALIVASGLYGMALRGLRQSLAKGGGLADVVMAAA